MRAYTAAAAWKVSTRAGLYEPPGFLVCIGENMLSPCVRPPHDPASPDESRPAWRYCNAKPSEYERISIKVVKIIGVMS